eukprot:CAMPEP_0115017812 /NCGR_PEP_ID=MMETSP0216-20121206/28367_1 /TAXON_ID=223996 /ORGANISM="Protocruzia adherens, Strain Boccale" /LENGTH=357 /DNA_ID=CAMNT_0002388755 /DNA_START=357 /DNA_END=1427 /DNA_ORIENTATION=-
MVLDRLILYTLSLHKTKPGDRTCILDNNTFRLSMKRPEKLKFLPGHYAYICIPSIRAIESHPFSICSGSDEENIEFVIRVIGPWTKKVYTAIESGKLTGNIYLRGTFPEKNIMGALEQKELSFISAGVGITPFLSMIRSLKPYDHTEKCIVAHVSSRRDCDFELLFEAIKKAEQQGIPASLYIYCTSNEENASQRIHNMVKPNGWSFQLMDKPVSRGYSKNFGGFNPGLLGDDMHRRSSIQRSCFLDDGLPLKIVAVDTTKIRERSRTLSIRKALKRTLDAHGHRLSSSLPLPEDLNNEKTAGDLKMVHHHNGKETHFPDVEIGDSLVTTEGEIDSGTVTSLVDVFFYNNRMEMTEV